MFIKNILTLDRTQEDLRDKGLTKGRTVAQAGDKTAREVAGHIRDRHRGLRNLYQELLRVPSQGQHGSYSATSKDAQKFQEILDWKTLLILARHSLPSCFNTITKTILRGPDSQTLGT